MKAFSVLFIFCASQASQADLALDLLKQADRARGSLEKGLTWENEVETIDDGESSTRKFLIKAKGNDAYVEALEPARNKGEIYLFNDRTMWFFKPSLKKPVAISAKQKLTGQAANGDIASTHYSRDYHAQLEKTENLNGEKTHVLLLKAKASNLTYDQIRYWISAKTKLGVKAEFLTLQGQVFKRANLEYKNKLSVDGQTYDFVSRMEITDAKNAGNKSIMKYSNAKPAEHSAQLFNVNNLKR
jgi:outer membrane lipoprotein-sorting protein